MKLPTTKILLLLFVYSISCGVPGVNNGSQQKENSVPSTVFFFDKGENASQAAEIENGVYGAGTENDVQFRLRRFHSGIFDVKGNVEDVENITDQITEIDMLVVVASPKSYRLTIRKTRFKKKLDAFVSHQLTPKNMMDRISIYEALAKRTHFLNGW